MFLTLENILTNTNYHIDIPLKKSEKWRLSGFHRILEQKYQLSLKENEYKEEFIRPKEGYWIYFRDGDIKDSLLPKSVQVKRKTKSIDIKDNPFALMSSNNSLSSVELSFTEDVYVKIFFIYSNKIFITSCLGLNLEEGVNVGVSISLNGANQSFVAHNLITQLKQDASLNLTQIQELEESGVLITQNTFDLKSHSTCNTFLLTHKGSYLQNFVHAELDFNSSMNITALLLSDLKQREFFSCDILHKKDSAKSNVYVKDVLKSESTCVFDVTTTIEKQTKGSIAYQANHALLLDDGAHVHSKPHLQIYSDDLMASHGCTVGELDEEAILYLLTRGISYIKAKQILVTAFIDDSISMVDSRSLGDVMEVLGDDYAS